MARHKDGPTKPRSPFVAGLLFGRPDEMLGLALRRIADTLA
jgi:hypothetical protein